MSKSFQKEQKLLFVVESDNYGYRNMVSSNGKNGGSRHTNGDRRADNDAKTIL